VGRKIFGGPPKTYFNKLKPLRGGGGGLPKISKKCRGPPKIMYNNNKTSAIIHCDINVNGI
jgi:hypothetical protein